MFFQRLDTERSNDHHTETNRSHDHTIGDFTRCRRFFTASGQPAKERHTDRCESHNETRIELLEDGSSHLRFGRNVQTKDDQQSGTNEHHRGGNDTTLRGFALHHSESRVNRHDAKEQSAHIEKHGRDTGRCLLRELSSEIGQGKPILVECHPEEDDHGENEAERNDASPRVGRRKFHSFFFCLVFFGGIGFFLLSFDVTEGRARCKIDKHRDDQRNTGHGKSEVVAIGLGETDVLGVLHDFHSRARSEERTDINGHVENGEGRVSLTGQFRTFVQVAHHDLEISFEKSRSHTNQCQCTDDGDHSRCTVAQGEGQQKVAQEHDRDADRHHATVTEFIGENTSDEGEEINEHQECGIVRPGESGTPSKVILEEQHENGQHRVVAESLAGVGESQSK